MSQKLDSLIVELKADINGFTSSMQSAAGTVARFEDRTNTSLGKVNAAVMTLRGAVLALGGAWAAFTVGRGVFEAGVQLQALNNRMKAAVGGTEEATAAMAYIRAESERLGLEFRTTADGFAQFSASALRAGLSMNATKQIFTNISEAAASLQLPVERVQLVFSALSQIAGKGTVSMEELRQQLGDSLPGALEIGARAMGKTTAEFVRMIGEGEVLASDFLPKFAAAVRSELGGSVDEASRSAQAAMNRLSNAFFELQTQLANSGLLDAVTQSVNSLTDALKDPQLAAGLSALVTLLAQIASIALRVAAAIGGAVDAVRSMTQALGDKVFGAFFGQRGLDALQAARNGPAMNTGSTIGAAGSAMDGLLFGDRTLGTKSPGMPNAAAQRAAEKAQKERDRLKAQLEGVRYDLGSPAEQEQADYEKKLETMKKALDAKLLTENQYRELSAKAEEEHQENLRKIALKGGEEALEDARQLARMREDLQKGVTDNLIGLLQQFAGKNKAIAIALIAIEKARAIASVLIAGQEAGMKAAAAAAVLGPAAAAAAYASMVNLSYVSAGLIAAQGLAQVAMMGGGGGGGGSSYASSASSESGSYNASGSSQGPEKQVYINLQGDDTALFSKNNVRKLIQQINDAVGDGSRLVVAVS